MTEEKHAAVNPPTIYEVAQLAGVSAATVSRVFSGRPGVSVATAARVKEIASSVGFSLNRTAQSLRRQHSSLIALLVPDVENPFFTAMARGVEDVAREAGYSVVLCNTDEDEAKEAHYLEIAVSENMAGVILAPAAEHTDLDKLVGRGRPIVSVDRGNYGSADDAVMVDNEPGSFVATRELIRQGYTRIACITGPEGVANAEQRAEGWLRAVGPVLDGQHPDAMLRHANYRETGGREAMLELLDRDTIPDAVFVANNMMAVGALEALQERGLSTESFGVAVFGALPFAILDPPRIVIVDFPAREIGTAAANALLDRLKGDSQPPRTIVLPTSLRVEGVASPGSEPAARGQIAPGRDRRTPLGAPSGPTRALADLEVLTAGGPRFHGTAGVRVAERLLTSWHREAGLLTRSHEVRTADWQPGETSLRVIAPSSRVLTAWPMLWSGALKGPATAVLRRVGVQGLWGDAMLWTKFAAVAEGRVVAYVHARDDGPAAPQPLPFGSDMSVPHLAIGRLDGSAIEEWIADGHEVVIEFSATAGIGGEAVSDSLSVDIPGRGGASSGRVLIMAHYDTFWNTPGAYDNGSGTIALVHLARSLGRAPANRPVTLLHTTAEEWHLAGSRAYVDALTTTEREGIEFAINLDGLGRGDFLEMFAGPERFERDVLRCLDDFRAETRPGLRVQSRFPPTCGSDHASFYSAGIPVVHFTFNDLHRLHQPEDLPNPGMAANVAWTVEMVRHLIEYLPPAERVGGTRLGQPF